MDKRTIETVQSIEVDFLTNLWQVQPLSDSYKVGAGLYVLVPVKDSQEADDLKHFVQSSFVFGASETVSEGTNGK